MANREFDKVKIKVEFEETANRQQISSGDNLNILFGKIRKWFSDLKPVAFTGKYTDLTGTPSVVSKNENGLVPMLPDETTTTKYLRQDGTWVKPPNTTYSAATQSAQGLMSSADKKKLDGIAKGANAYSLPLATASMRGGVKVGYTANGKNYPVQLNNEQMYVNVPWTDTNTNTWKENTKDSEGYVAKGSGQANKVWKTDANGNPAWRNDNASAISITNNLTATVSGTALDAVQGKVLNDKIAETNSNLSELNGKLASQITFTTINTVSTIKTGFQTVNISVPTNTNYTWHRIETASSGFVTVMSGSDSTLAVESAIASTTNITFANTFIGIKKS